MWPHFFKCGSWFCLRWSRRLDIGFNVAALFQVRKCCCGGPGGGGVHSFNVAALFQVRKFDDFLSFIILVIMLQCGRTFSSAEVSSHLLPQAENQPASMWPHFFKCGSICLFRILNRHVFASMWPHFFKCGSVDRTAADCSGINCFNVAALFQVRK